MTTRQPELGTPSPPRQRVRVRVASPVFRAIGDASRARAGTVTERRHTASREIVGWLVTLTLAAGPLALGYRPWAAMGVALSLVGLAFFIWVPYAIRRRAFAGVVVTISLLGLLAMSYAAIGVLNAGGTFDPASDRLVPVAHVDWLPSAAEASNALPGVACLLAAIGLLMIVADLGPSVRWRGRFLAAIASGGVMTAVVGVLENTPALADLRSMIASSRWSDSHPFGFLTYHNNAATVMNAAIPAIAALGLRGSVRRRWLATSAVVVLAGAATANLSRTGLVLGAIVAPASLAILWSGPISAGRGRRTLVRAGVIALFAMATLVGLVVSLQPAIVTRLANLDERWATYYPRYLQAKGAAELVARDPLFGQGVGGYRMLVSGTSIGNLYLAPKYRPGDPYTSTLTVTDDYLQTLVEWGVVGSLLWVAIVGGGIVCGAVAVIRPPGARCRREVALVLVGLFAIFAHALVDCPLQVPALQFAAAALLGLAWSAPQWRGHPVDPLVAFFR